MNSLYMKDKQKQQNLENVFNEIDNDLLEEGDIMTDLGKCLSDLDDEEQSKVIQFIQAKYPHRQFINKLSINTDIQSIDYKQMFINLKQQNQFEQMIQMIRNPQFCKENKIPTVLEQNILVIQKLGASKFKDILLIWENQNEQNNLTMLQQIKILIQIVYSKLLNHNEQQKIEIMLGSLLVKQTCQVQSYIDYLEENNKEKFQQFINVLQSKQMRLKFSQITIEEVNQDKRFSFILKLFSQNIRKSREYLNNYLSELLNMDIEKFIDINIIESLELQFSSNRDIFECYFTIVVYLWIQNSIQYQFFEQLNQQEINREKLAEDRRIISYQRLFEKICNNNDSVFQYFLNRMILFQQQTDKFLAQNSYVCLKKYQQYQFQEINSYEISVLKLLSLPKVKYEKFLASLQNLLFYYRFDHHEELFQKFLFILVLTEFDSSHQKHFLDIFQMEEVNIFQCAYIIQENFCVQSKNVLLKILKIASEYHNFDQENFYLLQKLNLKFNTFRDGDILIKFNSILGQSSLSFLNLEFISNLSVYQLAKIKFIFDQHLLLNVAQQILIFYLNNLNQKGRIIQTAILKLFLTLKKSLTPELFSIKILFQKVDHQLLHNVLYKNSCTPSLETFKNTLFMFYTLYDELSLNEKYVLSTYLGCYIKPQAYNFKLYHQLMIKKIEKNIVHKMILVYYYQEVGKRRELEIYCQEIYQWNRDIYQEWLEPLHYFGFFSITSQYLRRCELKNYYPQNMNIELEKFNISLVELTDQEKESLVSDWVSNMGESTKFKRLIPLYFNIIKREESPNQLLSFIHKHKKQDTKGSFNMKTLFQILFNNANLEMKILLLKFWSKNHPLPLIFKNFKCKRIFKEDHLYLFNQLLFYIWQDFFPIISLSFSKKQSQIGKTQLINTVFFQMEKFETCDCCEFNSDTADIIFDFSFNGSRHLAVADIHGRLPLTILKIILPLFHLWVIQFDSESELKENFDYLQNFNQIRVDKKPQICFIVRNSTSELKMKFENEILQIQKENISLHFIKDLTSKEMDKQILKNEQESATIFLFSEIKKRYQQRNFVGQSQFINVLKQFEYDSFIELLQQHCELISNIEKELAIVIEKPEGFFSEEAFPIRSIEQQIKIKKEEQIEQRLKAEQNLTKLEDLNNQIEKLKKQMNQLNQSRLMQLFCGIFNQENYYILYIWITDKIRTFNEEKMYQLRNETQDLNEQIVKAKKARNELKQQQQKQQIDETQKIKEKINKLKELLKESINKIHLRNIGIEIFWRELIQQKELYPDSCLLINPTDKIFEMIKKGEPFEFLDGDQLKINSKFLKQLVRKFEQQGEEKILILSILGPQSSGKSTILNKIFGCHFWTSVGRCTKGIYLQLLKLHNKQYFNNLFDYILLLDTEGLQNPNQLDPEFDKKIALFILAVSDIILINVKGDINLQFKNLVEMCIYTLGQLKNNFQSLKQLCWCFNQNNDVNNIGPFFDQIQEIATKLNTEFNKTESEDSNVDYNEILDIKKENIKILGFSAYEKSWKSHQFFQVEHQKAGWRQLISNDTFSEEAYHYGVQIMKSYANKFNSQRDSRTVPTLNQFMQNIEQNWNSIQLLPDLLEFSELIQHQQNQFMKIKLEEIYNKLDFKFKDRIQAQIYSEVRQSEIKNLEFFNELLKRIEGEIIQKIDIYKKSAIEDLQQVRMQNKISKKITVKYINQLEQLLQNVVIECKLDIFNETKDQERKYQEKQGFAKIDKFVADLLINQKELLKYQEQPLLISSEFNNLWQNITQEQEKKKMELFDEFQKKHFESIEQAFYSKSMKPKKHQEYYLRFKDEINERPNITQEKEEVFKIFEEELKQCYFQVLIKNQKQNLRYIDIFYQQIEKKIFSSSDNDLINLSSYYIFKVTWRVINKNKIETYFKNKFCDDFFVQLTRKKFNCQQFFSILDHFKVSFNESLYQIVVDIIKVFQTGGYKQKSEDDLRKSFHEFSQTINFNFTESIFIQNQEFISQFFSFYYNLKTETIPTKEFQTFAKLQNFSKDLLNQSIIIEERINVEPKQERNSLYFEVIINPQRSSNISIFQNKFASIFNDIMLNEGGYQQLFYSVYDIIKNEMIENKNNQQSCDADEKQKEQLDIEDDNIDFSSSLIKIIMTKIEQKIEQYNKQFSAFGLILRDLGERIIYYYSSFIIWRFICLKKLGLIEKNRKMLMNNQKKQFEKFQAKINLDKQEQTKIKTESLVNEIYQGFINNFYLENKEIAAKMIQTKSLSCQKLIQQLDNQLLQQFKKNEIINQKNDGEEQKNIIKYITDQVSFVNSFADSYVLKIQGELQSVFGKRLSHELLFFLNQIKKNTLILKGLIKNQILQIQEIFNQQPSTDEKFYEYKLFKIIIDCIQGGEIQDLKLIKEQYRPLFQSQDYQKLQQQILPRLVNQSDQYVLLLKSFVEKLLDQLELKIQNIGELKFNLSNFQIQSKLDTIRLKMRGCQHSCPICKRKCDLDSEIHQKHICNNGHQLRGIIIEQQGMNGVLMGSTPSLYTCEEIEDDMTIMTIETGTSRCWKEVKQIYPEWLFRSLTKGEIQLNKSKMIDVWNNGIGILICNNLEKQLNRKVFYQNKNETNVYFTSSKIHYILILDDSYSMMNEKWLNVQQAAEQCIKEIQKNLNAMISVIIFNSSARLVINCQNANLQIQQIQYQGGGTDFNKAFDIAYKSIINQQEKFDKIVLLFYTDGEAVYPETALRNIKSLHQSILAKITFSACTQEKDAPILNHIVNNLKGLISHSEIRNNLQTQALNQVWQEVVSQTYHKLRQ